MIIINLKGGLGNQLFQYATGRALSLRQADKNKKNSAKNDTSNKQILKLDITGYSENNGIDTMRHYALSPFNIKVEIASTDEIKKLKYPFGIISKGWRFFKTKVLKKYNISFNSGIFNSTKPLYLDGFFQTEKYFIDKENEIRNDLTLKDPLSQRAVEILTKINSCSNSISLHVRRGDYVSDKNTNLHHGTCDLSYYAKAVEYMNAKIGNDMHIFVFSDGIEWAKENIKFPYQTSYVSPAKSTPRDEVEELVLMSKCRNNIIANSSFSWWGAWLNQNRDKIVIAPKRWVLRGVNNYRDIIPQTWYKI